MKRLGLLVAAAVLGLGGVASAQNNVVKPQFMVMVDTSGSMIIHQQPANTCGYMHQLVPPIQNPPGTTITVDRISNAKCVLTRIINGTGDALFGLARFTQGHRHRLQRTNLQRFDATRLRQRRDPRRRCRGQPSQPARLG